MILMNLLIVIEGIVLNLEAIALQIVSEKENYWKPLYCSCIG